MAKRKSLIGGLISGILSLVFLVAIVIGGLCLFVKVKYDINIFDAVSQVKTLTEDVNESELFTNTFSDDDFASTKTTVNVSAPNLVSYSETDGYSISENVSGAMSVSMQLTDKQCASLISMILNNQETPIGVEVAGKTINFKLIQIKFENLVENSVDVNVVVKLDITPIKQDMTGFPLNYLSNFIPDDLYISSTVTVTKGENAFEYSTASKGLAINNLNQEETSSLLTTINTFISFGDVETLNLSIGGAFVDALLGSEQTSGFAYTLKNIGATDFNFVNESNNIVLEILV